MKVRDDFVDTVGNTPLVKLRRASEETGCTILGKAEFMNPGQSVKDRAGLFIIRDAVKSGRIPGRLLWMLDRGAFPRPQDQLEAALRAHFDIVHEEEFAILHRYVLWVGNPLISGA